MDCHCFSSGGGTLGPYSWEISTLLVTSNTCGCAQSSRRIARGLSAGQSRQVPGGESNAAAASSAALLADPRTVTGQENSMLNESSTSAPTNAPAITSRVRVVCFAAIGAHHAVF